jgi:hypothetical protein
MGQSSLSPKSKVLSNGGLLLLLLAGDSSLPEIRPRAETREDRSLARIVVSLSDLERGLVVPSLAGLLVSSRLLCLMAGGGMFRRSLLRFSSSAPPGLVLSSAGLLVETLLTPDCLLSPSALSRRGLDSGGSLECESSPLDLVDVAAAAWKDAAGFLSTGVVLTVRVAVLMSEPFATVVGLDDWDDAAVVLMVSCAFGASLDDDDAMISLAFGTSLDDDDAVW